MAGPKPSGSDRNFALLEGLRGVGALGVVFGHSSSLWGSSGAPSGNLVVDLFFLMSGFVIAFSYEPALLSGAIGARGFMLHRVIRLYPLYLLGIVLGYLIHLAMTFDDPTGERAIAITQDLAINIAGLPSPPQHGLSLYELNGAAWTLFFEIGVNFIYVIAFRWLRDTRVLATVVGFCLAALVLAVFSAGKIDIGAAWPTWWGGYARAGFGFFAGVLMYRLLGSPRTARRSYSPWSLALLFAAPLLAFLPAPSHLRAFVDLSLLMIAVPMLALATTIAPPTRFMRLCAWGGQLSYAIYILHFPILEALQRIGWRYPEIYSWRPLPGVALALASVTIALLAERYWDRPLRRFVVAKLRHEASRASLKGVSPVAAE